jgi:hypothetical protein
LSSRLVIRVSPVSGLDGAIVGASLFVVAWVTLLRGVYSATGVNRLDEFLSIACPIAGIVTVTVAVLGLARADAQWRPTLITLTTGLTLIAAAGGAYVFSLAHHSLSHLADSAWTLEWPAGLVLVGIAALKCPPDAPETSRAPSGSTTPISLWLPYIPLAIAAGLEFANFRSALHTDPAFVVVPWLVIAVLARQFMVITENRRLLHSASDRALRDPLTNLANRVLFHDRLEHVMQLYHRDHGSVRATVQRGRRGDLHAAQCRPGGGCSR